MNVIIDANQYITENIARKITKAGVKSVEIRSAITCKSSDGVCQKCYGLNPATGNIVEIGDFSCLEENKKAFAQKLKECGFLRDLSDATSIVENPYEEAK